jgi:CRP-like cAMP-binding protein
MPQLLQIQKGDFLFREGDVAEDMYIIKSGEISLIVSDGVSELIVARASSGQLIGEMSLFDKKLRSASAKAVTPVEVVQLPYAKLESELETMPEWVQVTLKTLSEKIRQANSKLLKNTKSS